MYRRTHVSAAPPAGRLLELKTAYHTTFDVYVAGPEQAVRGALLVPDRWGFHRPAMAWAERLAAQGRVPDEVTAREILRDIDPVWIEADLDSALSYLRRHQRQVVVVAWGEGIAHAMDLVQRRPGEVQALVSYHTRRSKGIAGAGAGGGHGAQPAAQDRRRAGTGRGGVRRPPSPTEMPPLR